MFIRSRCLLLLACRLAAVAATPQGGGQWSEIPADELAIKDDPFNPGAKAIVLYHEVSNDDVRQLESHHYRIKVLTDEGRSLGDVQIPYAEKISSVGDIRARVVQPDGRTVYFNGQVFDKLVVKARKVQVQEKTFTLPEVRSGSIIEYVYATHWQQKAPDVLRHPRVQAEIDRRQEVARNADPLRRREEELHREQARLEKSTERLVTAYQEGLGRYHSSAIACRICGSRHRPSSPNYNPWRWPQWTKPTICSLPKTWPDSAESCACALIRWMCESASKSLDSW